jgi:hypothetical protein
MQLPSASADSLYWADALLKTNSVHAAYGFASDALRHERAVSVRRSPIEVAGSVGRSYVAIHCVGTTPRVTAIIMVVGPDSTEAIRTRDAVRTAIMKIQLID